ncbi:MAG: Na+/Ca+ antiporter, CaCA family [Microgenomates group bacterium GW2011_GWC1_37_12b]|uniref:Na+/Ca+ antiporter, CaCA family n=1 Tax=Candidatus Woesebacteria bacterium GW2011_GWB1_38_8b TaxID=1618571 RepID=A0A0G0PAK1_9BACT|nr:MAG: Na+/Ca+ antiporter, CaCA family [Microgenomates group bacterium GW2011_GWC1_37_12b]KKQ86336.1 MAG: Na+/Ca+ antiporter, CaCA family [Candidatus Woesebacteria bacterium GW2011_GWB1_38_8b]
MVFLIFLVCLVLSLLFVSKFAQVAIKHLTIIANVLRWNAFVIAFLILGVATSIPEFLIGINSALDKTPQLSLGNLIGATIVLLTLVTGLTAFISGKVGVDSNFTKNDLFVTTFILFFPLALFYDNYFGRADAIIVLVMYGFYITKVYRDRHKLRSTTEEPEKNGKILKHLFVFLGSFAIVAISSKMAVESAVYIAETIKLPLLLVGILVFSIGTNLPELTLAITAIRKKDTALIGGNVLGSATTNSLIIAILGLIYPIKIIETQLFMVSIFFFTIAVLVFAHFVKSRSEISRIEGFFLLTIYFLFLIFEIITKLV